MGGEVFDDRADSLESRRNVDGETSDVIEVGHDVGTSVVVSDLVECRLKDEAEVDGAVDRALTSATTRVDGVLTIGAKDMHLAVLSVGSLEDTSEATNLVVLETVPHGLTSRSVEGVGAVESPDDALTSGESRNSEGGGADDDAGSGARGTDTGAHELTNSVDDHLDTAWSVDTVLSTAEDDGESLGFASDGDRNSDLEERDAHGDWTSAALVLGDADDVGDGEETVDVVGESAVADVDDDVAEAFRERSVLESDVEEFLSPLVGTWSGFFAAGLDDVADSSNGNGVGTEELEHLQVRWRSAIRMKLEKVGEGFVDWLRRGVRALHDFVGGTNTFSSDESNDLLTALHGTLHLLEFRGETLVLWRRSSSDGGSGGVADQTSELSASVELTFFAAVRARENTQVEKRGGQNAGEDGGTFFERSIQLVDTSTAAETTERFMVLGVEDTDRLEGV